MMAQVFEQRSCMWQAWVQLQFDGMAWPSPSCYGHLGSKPEWIGGMFSQPLSLSLPVKYIHFWSFIELLQILP